VRLNLLQKKENIYRKRWDEILFQQAANGALRPYDLIMQAPLIFCVQATNRVPLLDQVATTRVAEWKNFA